jgi:hypothetical protein
VGSWLPGRGGRSCFRRDRFQRAHDAHPEPVPGSTDFLTDRIRRTDALRCVCLAGRVLLIEVLLIEHIIVAWHISAGERVCIPLGVFIPVADRIRIPELIPVRLPDPDPDSLADPYPRPDLFLIQVLAGIRAGITVPTGTALPVVERMPGGGSVLWTIGDHKVQAKIRCEGGAR